jgi:hypothetical protein
MLLGSWTVTSTVFCRTTVAQTAVTVIVQINGLASTFSHVMLSTNRVTSVWQTWLRLRRWETLLNCLKYQRLGRRPSGNGSQGTAIGKRPKADRSSHSVNDHGCREVSGTILKVLHILRGNSLCHLRLTERWEGRGKGVGKSDPLPERVGGLTERVTATSPQEQPSCLLAATTLSTLR